MNLQEFKEDLRQLAIMRGAIDGSERVVPADDLAEVQQEIAMARGVQSH